MKLKKAEIVNKGMVQDYSISKSSQEFAYENHNIRIQTNDDCTSMSITNIKGPEYKNIDLQGIIIGKCILPNYIVIFTTSSESSNTPDRIYRLDLNFANGTESVSSNLLFEGNLNFDKNYLIDTIYFLENSNVIKVYWTDGLNNPRFINIITEGERVATGKILTPYTDSNVFNFYPKISSTPKIELQKSFEYDSELPNGVIQYFVSYYNNNGAETLLSACSDPITIDYIDRGAKADDPQGSCSITLNISNLDTQFECIRVYSVTRTAEYGEPIVKIVHNAFIRNSNTIQILDDGTNQESISFAQFLYIGGQPLIAKTLTQKDGTLFLGNLSKEKHQIPDSVYEVINDAIKQYNDVSSIFSNDNYLIKSPFVTFNQNKVINTYDSSQPVHYPYFRQTLQGFSKYKTFKSGEVYRFGIQFQTEKGEWLEVIWIGDAECEKRPIVNPDNTVCLNNAVLDTTELLDDNTKNTLNSIGITNYRLVIADPVKHNGRKIKAQGVLCPTLFNLKKRLQGTYANASWIMRPRSSAVASHHLEPLVDYTSVGAEIVTNYNQDNYPNVTTTIEEQQACYLGITYMTYSEASNNKLKIKCVKFKSNDFAATNGYNFFGQTTINAENEDVKTIEFDSIDAFENCTDSEFKDIIQKMKDEGLIPRTYFENLFKNYNKNFWLKFGLAFAMVILSVASGGILSGLLGAAQALIQAGVSLSLTGVSTLLGSGLLYLGTLAGLGAVNTIDINSPLMISPQLSNEELKKIIGDKELDADTIDLLKKRIVQYPEPYNSAYSNPAQGPSMLNVNSIFSDTAHYYTAYYQEDGVEKALPKSVCTLPTVFKPSITSNDLCFFQLVSVGPVIKTSSPANNDYFVDESVLTLHSPDINEDTILNNQCKCNIIGYVPLNTNNYFDAEIEVTPSPYGSEGGLNTDIVLQINNSITEYNPFYSGKLYTDLAPNNLYYTNYWCYLYGPSNIVGGHVLNNDNLGNIKSSLVKKKIFNHIYSNNSIYFNDKSLEKKYDAHVDVFRESPIYLEPKNTKPFSNALYEGNHSNGYIVENMIHKYEDFGPEINDNTNEDIPENTSDFINISMNSTPHALLYFNTIKNRIPLLPILGVNNINRYLSIRDGVEEGKWKHNVLQGDRLLMWDNYLNNISNNVFSKEYMTIASKNSTTIDELFTNFENNYDEWSKYKDYFSALQISNALIAYDGNFDVDLQALNDRAFSIIEYNNNALWKTIYHIQRNGDDVKITNDNDYLDFIFTLIKRQTIAIINMYSLYPQEHFSMYFLLGLFLFFGNDGTTKQNHIVESHESTLYYHTPQFIKDNGKEQVFLENVYEFRELFKQIFLYCSYARQYPDCITPVMQENLQNLYDKIFEVIDKIKNICTIEESLMLEYRQSIIDGDTDKAWSLHDTYAYAQILDQNGESLLNANLFMGLVGKDSDDNPFISYSIEALFNNFKQSLLVVKNAFVNKLSEEKVSEVAYISYYIKPKSNDYEKSQTTAQFDVTQKKTKLYSFIVDSNNNVQLVQGYDNSKGLLKYNDIFYIYNNETNSLEKLSDTDLDLYYQEAIATDVPNSPYLMLAEIYNDIPYNALYGGHTEQAIKNLTWYPVSNAVSLDDSIEETFGDTVYQRYDCLKTYPSTEEDINQNVDITSFMVESHINLDDRVDQNRGKFNIMTRPHNFNLFNTVYNSNNDILVYTAKQLEVDAGVYPNQFIWSLSKNYLGEVDTWTNISFAALNQCKHPITKLCSFKDKIISFNTKSIEYIDFNAKSFVSTDNGFIELQNNNKVTGTISISDVLGTNNYSIQITEKGIYYVDTNECSIIRLNQDGSIFKIGLSKMNSWLKNNIKQNNYSFDNPKGIHLEYDFINKELHILNEDFCLVYNEILEEFTSFLDLQQTIFMFSFNNNTWSLGNINNNSSLYKMYSGNYNTGYNGEPIGYSVHYRINPELDTDKVFTNIDFVADMGTNNNNSSKTTEKPFDTIRVWNEYQDTGVQPLNFLYNRTSNLKQKFRTWRVDIPRDQNSLHKRDRIRNPWIHLCLSKSSDSNNSNSKMEMHTLNIQYMS